ncbi:MAG: sulfite exporter TauE/SafE family protein [Pseudomonadota bacterium]
MAASRGSFWTACGRLPSTAASGARTPRPPTRVTGPSKEASLSADLVVLIPALAVAGALTGVLAGLFGVGGGAIIVPVLYELFRMLDVPDHLIMPLSVGTSLAVIIPTSLRSFRGHLKQGVADTAALKSWVFPVLIGVLAGAAIARFAEPWVFKLVFIGVAGVNAVRLLVPAAANWQIATDLPTGFLRQTYGAVIGLLSSLMGIGGGALYTLMMTLHGRPIHQAIATSSGLGVIISIPGALGYIAAGWPQMADLPPLSLGFVSLIGVLALVPMSLLTTPWGVRLAHALPKRRLEIAFGLFLLAVAARFVTGMIWGY